MSLSKELLAILICPQCKAELEYRAKQQELVCQSCKLIYQINDGIPNMIPEQAHSLSKHSDDQS